MRFVGLDTAYRNTGVVILDGSGGLLYRAHLANKALFDPQGFLFWLHIAEKTLRPNDVVAIEGLSYGSIGKSHVLAGAHAMWMIAAYARANVVFVVPPIRVKKWAVNDVKAQKPKLITWAKNELGLSKKDNLSEHEADALALAQIALASHNVIRSVNPDDTGLPEYRHYMLRNAKGDGVTQALGKSYFEGMHYGG